MDVALIGIGYGVQPALAAAAGLAKDGIRAAVVNARFVKPLDETLILEVAEQTRRIVTIEDGVLAGGFGSAVLELLERRRVEGVSCLRLGLPDRFVEHGARKKLLEKYGLDGPGVEAAVRAAFFTGARRRSAVHA